MRKGQKEISLNKTLFLLSFFTFSFFIYIFNLHLILFQIFISKPLTLILIPNWLISFLILFNKKIGNTEIRKETKEKALFYSIFITFLIFYFVFFSSNIPTILAQTSCPTGTYYKENPWSKKGNCCSEDTDCVDYNGNCVNSGNWANGNDAGPKDYCDNGAWLRGICVATDMYCVEGLIYTFDTSGCYAYKTVCPNYDYYVVVAACGSDEDCKDAAVGHKCLSNGLCGCLSDSDCPAKDNVKGKCDSPDGTDNPDTPGYTYTCYWKPCGKDADCVSGTYCYCGYCSSTYTSAGCSSGCCNRGYGGTGIGQCVSLGTIYNTQTASYLCTS